MQINFSCFIFKNNHLHEHLLKAKSSTPLRKKCPGSELIWCVFPAFELNTERYGVSLQIQSKCGKIRTRITPNTDTFHAVLIFRFDYVFRG